MEENQLLGKYCRDGNQEAFAELVRRHGDWVYCAARRQLRDEHLAEDVTQAVFILLVKKANRLRGHANLGGWLFGALRYCVGHVRREQARRQRREREVAKMRSEMAVEQADWSEISPVLDDAVSGLGKADREAVLLRFYQRKSLAEVGGALGVSEEAARKRVGRAVEKLRGALAEKGVMAGTAALGVVLAEKVTEAAPLGAIQGAMAATGGGGNVVAGGIVKGAIKMMAWAKVKTAAALSLAALVLGGVGVEATRIAPAQDGHSLATGATATTSPALVALTQDVLCVDRQGRPVAGVQVFLRCTISHSGSTRKGAVSLHGPVLTDASGVAHFNDLPNITPEDLGWQEDWYARIPDRMVGVGRRAHYGKLTLPQPFGPAKIGMVAAGTIRGKITVPPGLEVKAVSLRGEYLSVRDGLTPNGVPLFNSHTFGDHFHYVVGADGSFTVPDVPREGAVYLVADGPGLAEVQWGGCATDLPLQLTMEREGVIEGTVTYGTKGPAAGGISIVAGQVAADRVYVQHSLTAVSGPDGRYRIKGLREGLYSIICPELADWTMATRRNVHVISGQAIDTPLQLEKGAVVAVKAMDIATKRPLAQVSISALNPADPGAPRIGGGKTDQDGKCLLRVPVGGSLLYIMSSPDGYDAATKQDSQRTVEIQPGQSTAEMTFWLRAVANQEPSGVATVRGRIVDAEGKAVANLSIADAAIERWGTMDMPVMNNAAAKTDADGRYDFPAGAGIKHKVHPSGADYDLPESREFTPKAGTTYTVEDLVVHPRPIIGHITGTVLDPDGQPIRGAAIGFPGDWNAPLTDEAGAFSFPVRQRTAPERIWIRKTGYAQRNWNDVPPDGANLVFILHPTDDPTNHHQDAPLPRPGALIGKRAPAFEVERWVFNGDPVPSPVRSDGKDTLLVFAWSCDEPAEALKLIQRLDAMATERKAAAVCIFGTASHESGIRATLKGYRPSAAIGIDQFLVDSPNQTNRVTLSAYGFENMPQLFIISADGTVREATRLVIK